MAGTFTHDVFLSYSGTDAPVAHELARRLKADGVRVWLDAWEVKAGEHDAARIEEGLERSHALILFMSANAFAEWPTLEATTFRFRNALDKNRRFIPLRLDEAPIEASVAQFMHINWREADRETEYAKVREACRTPAPPPTAQATEVQEQAAKSTTRILFSHSVNTIVATRSGDRVITAADEVRMWSTATGELLRPFACKPTYVGPCMIALSRDDTMLLCGDDAKLVLLDLVSGERRQTLEGHRYGVHSVALSANGKRAISSSHGESSLYVWELASGTSVRLDGQTGHAYSLAMSADGRLALSGSDDKTVRLWDAESGRCLRVMEGHTSSVRSLAFSPDMRHAASGSETVRVHDVKTGRYLVRFEGSVNGVDALAWCADRPLVLSGSSDGSVRVWNAETGACVRVLRGHDKTIKMVGWSDDGMHAFSADSSGGFCVWDLTDLAQAPAGVPSRGGGRRGAGGTVAGPAAPAAPRQVQYTNAKVLLVGDSGVGKSGLSNYLAHDKKVDDDKPIPSTDGAWATHWPLEHDKKKDGVEREIWLWDFAGQVDYRLVHQLFMDDTAAAVLVFNPQSENPFEALGQWDRDLQKATRKPFAKLLAAGRIDRGGLVVSMANMTKFMAERGFPPPLHLTSAKTGEGCDALKRAIIDAVDWRNIPETTSPALYHRLKQEILNLRDGGLVLIRLAELNQRMELTLAGEEFSLAELNAVVGLLSGPGMIQRLDFGGFILLRPEVLSRYAAAVVRKVRMHPQEMGCIREDELLAGTLDYQDFERLPRDDEAVVLRALLETFVSRAWCLRQPCDRTSLLTFPSYFRRERREQPSHPSVLVTYRFDGPADDIYATLVVRLHHTVAFESTNLWRSAADFRTQSNAALGFTLARESEGTSRLEVYFEPNVDENSRVVFLRYVHEHLTQHAQNVVRLRHYSCENKKCDACGQAFSDQAKIDKALAPGGKMKVFCPDCGKPIHLKDAIEAKFESTEVREQVRALDADVQVRIDNESRELMAVHHTGFIVAEAGQIYRGFTNSDHGLDGEIEFKDHAGEASGKRLYVQLKSGDSYLKKRQRDGAEVFQIKNPRWAEYWQQHAYTVMLVVRTSDGVIRWMDVTTYLRQESKLGKPVRQIVFEGEPLDVMSVQRWRQRLLPAPR